MRRIHAQFQVDSERVVDAARAVASSATAVDEEVETMMTNLTGLQDSWQGSAAEGFQTIVDDWRGVQKQVQESLESIREALDTAGSQYADVEEANLRMFRG